MKRLRFSFVVALVLAAVSALAAPGARAQGGLTYISSIQVQNLSSSQATVNIRFYDEATGNEVAGAAIPAQIGAGKNVSYFPIPNLNAGFRGSAVVESDQPIAAITNLQNSGLTYFGSATGLTAGSRNVGLPLIQRGNSGFNTFFSVQNAGDTDATVNIAFTPGTVGTAMTLPAFTLKPGASKTFDQQSDEFAQLSGRFVGSATITSDQPVVAMVSQLGTGAFKAMLMYDGFANGSTTVRAPLVMANNSGFLTTLNIQNVGDQQTRVTVSYSDNSIANKPFKPANKVLDLNPGQGGNVFQFGEDFSQGGVPVQYIGAATITANQPLVVVVNQQNNATGKATSYEGFNPGALTNDVSAPLLMANNANYFTSVQCQNAGTTEATVTITYSQNTVDDDNNPSTPNKTPEPDTMVVKPGAMGVTFQARAANPTKWSYRYIGSASIRSNAEQPIACLVNQLNTAGNGDTFLTYNAINY